MTGSTARTVMRSAVAAAPTKEMANDVQEVERLTSQLTEEERLLFDLVASDHLHQKEKNPRRKGTSPFGPS